MPARTHVAAAAPGDAATQRPPQLLAAKDAEIGMLRQQLVQLSADLARNLEHGATLEVDARENREAVAVLTALLAEKDALFARFEEQVGALEALRQKEAAECKALQAALDSHQQDSNQQLQAEAARREALEQQLKQSEEAAAAQLMSARQAAVNESVQHSSQLQVELERAAGCITQLQQQVQQLQDALAGKESELAAAQMQLASAVASSKRLQDSHAQAMAAKSALVSQVQEELQQVKAGHSQSNKAHEVHISQLVASIQEMQELCANQAAELQHYASAQRGLEEQQRARQEALERKEETCSKAEMRRSAMEGALQSEVTAHAAIKAHHSMLLDGLAGVLADVQQQHTSAQASVAQLSCQLSEAQEQLVSAAAAGCQQASPHNARMISQLEAQCQDCSTQLLLAETRAASLDSVRSQLHGQLAPFLRSGPAQHAAAAAAAASPACPQAAAGWHTPPRPQTTCTAALAQALQQQPCHRPHNWPSPQHHQQQCSLRGTPQVTPQRRQAAWPPGGCGGACTPPTAGYACADAPPQQQLSGLVGQLQAGVARLQQQLGASQQQMLSTQAHTASPQANSQHHQQQQPAQQQQPQRQRGSASAHRVSSDTQPPLALLFQGTRHAAAAAAGQCGCTQPTTTQAAGPALSACSSDCGSTLSCNAEVAAAVAVARRRLEQQLPLPQAADAYARRSTGRSPAAAATSGSKRRGRAKHSHQQQAGGSHTAELAALASATLKKLEQLSAEGASKWG